MPNDIRLLSPADVAEMLSVSRWTVYHWISSRQIESVKLGRLVRVPASEVTRLIQRRSIAAEEEQ